ncbi:MAG TPA: LysR substrate-binding domain-containing protein [Myxococcales bacterium]|nr:LysR substrate-binding domain-containing protein [Myxococcales bacterium]
MKHFPIELLQTFIATVETGSMAKAAQVVGRTPSAVSLQMTKLSSLVGQPLFRRRGREHVLTGAAEALVAHARDVIQTSERAYAAMRSERLEGPVRFGTVQDLADSLLPRALAGFARRYPGVALHVQVARSDALLEQARSGDLDFAVCFSGARALREIRREPMVWLGHREVAQKDPLPLAVLDPACGYIEAAAESLRRQGRPFTVVLRTPSLLGLRAALEAGFAVGCRTALLKSGSIEVLGVDENLPALPSVGFALYIPRPLGAAARRLASLVRELVGPDGAPALEPVQAAS